MGYIDDFEFKSVYIIREANAQLRKGKDSDYANIGVLCSFGKDSTTMLHLIRKAFLGKIPFDVIHIDTGVKLPEIYKFREMLQKKWGFNLVIAKNEEGIRNTSPEKDVLECCTQRKTRALQMIIEEKGYDGIMAGIRRDEHAMRNIERYFSPRDRNFGYHFVRPKTKEELETRVCPKCNKRFNVFEKIDKDTVVPYVDFEVVCPFCGHVFSTQIDDAEFESLQDIEIGGIYAADFGPNVHHIRIHPMLHWTEQDVWKYIKQENLPVNPLYFSNNGKRYRSLGCAPCTSPIKSNAKTIDDIIKELEVKDYAERSGRAQDKEDEEAMRKLRSLGYP